MEPHPNTLKRNEQEKEGGWLPVFIEAEPDPCDPARGTLRCYYCGFAYGTGHDWACRFLAADVPELQEEKERIILVPKDGLPAPNSFF